MLSLNLHNVLSSLLSSPALITLFIVSLLTAVIFHLLAKPTHTTTKAQPSPSSSSIPTVALSDPVLGNLGDIKKHGGSFHAYLNHLHSTYGSDAVQFHYGTQPVVSVASAASFKCTLKLANRPVLLFQLFEPLIGKQSLQFANNDEWKQRKRQYVAPAFSHQSITTMIKSFAYCASRTLQQWNEQSTSSTTATSTATASSSSTDVWSLTVPVVRTMSLISIQSICMTSLGSRQYRALEPTLRLKLAYDVVWAEMESRVDGSVCEPGSVRQKQFDTNLQYIHGLVAQLIEERRTHKQHQQEQQQAEASGSTSNEAESSGGGGGDDSKHALIDHLLAYTDDEQLIAHDVVTFLVGGFHTTGNMLAWLFYYLAIHPQVQQRVRDELEQQGMCDRLSKHGTLADVSLSDLGQLVYTKQVLDETLRHSVLAPFAARYSDADLTLPSGAVIPAGTPIIQSLGFALHDPAVWPSPHLFDPERFSPDACRQRSPLSFSAFGLSGGRLCPGSRYAYTESLVVCATLLSAYRVELSEQCLPVEAVTGFVTHPKHEILLKATRC